MPEIGINIEVYCSGCGAGLCNQTEAAVTRTRREPCFRVEPCAGCLEKARAEAYAEGRDGGYDAGYEAARKEFEKDGDV